MNEPIIISNGENEIKIYTVKNRGRDLFQLSYYQGGERERKSFASRSEAKREAKLTLNKMKLEGEAVDQMTTVDMESYLVAKKHIAATGLPLHVCAETFGALHGKLTALNVSVTEAVTFYLEFHRDRCTANKTFLELVADFVAGRRAMGVGHDYVNNIERQLKRLAASFPGRVLALYRTVELDQWVESQLAKRQVRGAHQPPGRPWDPITRNNVRTIFITFGNWAKGAGYLPTDRPTVFEGMRHYKEPKTKVAIYTTDELRTMLDLVRVERPELLAWMACAAFLGARVSELATLRWENIKFERGFVEVASEKVRTKARRIVPLHDVLREWLALCRQESGPIVSYRVPRVVLRNFAKEKKLKLQDNGFRHSYISYRLAQINDTARVALESGNSPAIIFANYRELVGPDEATTWFATLPTPVGAAPVFQSPVIGS